MPDLTRYRAALWAVVVGVLLTALVLLTPFVRFAYEAPALRVALETVNAVVGLLVAYLVYGRYRETARLQDLLLILALSTVAVANLALTALPAALPVTDPLGGWASLAVRFLGTLLLTAAALSARSLEARSVAARRPALLVVAVVMVLGVLDVLLGDRLPPPVAASVRADDAAAPVVAGHPVVLAVQVLSGLLYATCAVAFSRRAAADDDELLRWVGAGCVLAAFARIHYLLFPSLYSEYFYTGDLLRLGFYLLLLVGGAREIRSFWESRAVSDDRRRLARDLHDGLTQELTYIYAQTRHLAAHPDDLVAVGRVNDAAARAIDEARAAIAALTYTDRPDFGEALRSSVEAIAQRYDLRAHVEADDALRPSAERAEAVLRIVAEAVRNAARHGGASRVDVRLGAEPFELVVSDDGSGFDPASGSTGGFGLTSMRQRAESTGASFDVTSSAGQGATVRVVWT